MGQGLNGGKRTELKLNSTLVRVLVHAMGIWKVEREHSQDRKSKLCKGGYEPLIFAAQDTCHGGTSEQTNETSLPQLPKSNWEIEFCESGVCISLLLGYRRFRVLAPLWCDLGGLHLQLSALAVAGSPAVWKGRRFFEVYLKPRESPIVLRQWIALCWVRMSSFAF